MLAPTGQRTRTERRGGTVSIRNRRRLLAGVAVGAFFLAGCQADEPETEATSSPSEDLAGLPDECSEWADEPTDPDALDTNAFIGSAVWEKVDGYLWFEASWTNTTELVAVNVTADLRIIFDGEDITDDLPEQETLAEYQPHTVDLILPGETERTGEIEIDVPPSPQWAEGDKDLTDLEADPTVEQWCVPKEDVV